MEASHFFVVVLLKFCYSKSPHRISSQNMIGVCFLFLLKKKISIFFTKIFLEFLPFVSLFCFCLFLLFFFVLCVLVVKWTVSRRAGLTHIDNFNVKVNKKKSKRFWISIIIIIKIIQLDPFILFVWAFFLYKINKKKSQSTVLFLCFCLFIWDFLLV